MIFNSLNFAIFLPVVFMLYWLIGSRSLKIQNNLILLSSYFFYGWWDWRFLTLIIGSTILDYVIGKSIHAQDTERKRKNLLILSLSLNLGLLGFFKYFNFFIESLTSSFAEIGIPLGDYSLNIILPVGISFYTFQTLSYTIDIYRKKLTPTQDFVAFASFVSFFPQLVAGPIERAADLLPQFTCPRQFDYNKAVIGLRQILWGLFKKVVIADSCGFYVDQIFQNTHEHTGSTLILGAIFFTFQIYCDFSGYSDIAIGTARLLGFNLTRNFAYPFFSKGFGEFWQRWHISLSSWFRDYLYIPLGGSRISKLLTFRNIIIVFLISGLWHGANWTFIAWGGLHALYYLPNIFLKNGQFFKLDQGKLSGTIFKGISVLITFSFTTIAFIFFRSDSISQAMAYISEVFTGSSFTKPEIMPFQTIVLLGFLISFEFFNRKSEFALKDFAANRPRLLRWGFYSLIIALVLIYNRNVQEFIYFQF